MDVKLSNMEQAMTAADVENLQGKLAELGANLVQIMDAQQELLDIRDQCLRREDVIRNRAACVWQA